MTAFQGYIWKILSLNQLNGMKALIMDPEVTRMVGMTCSLTEVIAKEVFVIEKIHEQPKAEDVKRKAAMAHLKAVCILRPVKESIDHLCNMLKAPRFKEYHVFFTNTVPPEYLRQLAEADAEHELVRQVHEYYADYYAITSNLFSVEAYQTAAMYHNKQYWRNQDRQSWSRNLDAVASMILTHKALPTIRFTRSSELTKTFAADLTKRIRESDGLFQFPQQREEALLLILDRRDDPVTPLLQSWTYQAMVHEQLGIVNNTVDLSAAPKVRPDQREVVMAAYQDKFFEQNMYLNFGDMASVIKGLMAEYQKTVQGTSRLDTIEDMQRAIEKYPEVKAQAGNVSKHVTVMGELSRLVSLNSLMDVSELEQELACSSSHSSSLASLLKLIESPTVRFKHKLNLVLLYALRYETERQQILQLKELLKSKASNEKERARIRAVDEILRVAGSAVRGSDIFSNKSVLAKVSTFIGSSVKGIENVYTRHKPYLSELMDALSRGKLRTRDYPSLDNESGSQPQSRPDLVYVFVLGGTTYSESAAMHIVNVNTKDYGGMRVLLGGSCVHNSKTYIDDLLQEEDAPPSGSVAIRVNTAGPSSSNDEYKR